MTEPNITSDLRIKNDAILRRYMDLPKLLDLLHSKSLYFRRADGFSDRLEGALFPSLRKSIDQTALGESSAIGADEFYRRAREGNYVCCWTIGARDNMALWQLYGGVNTSVAITTTANRIIKCAYDWNRLAHLQQIKYINHKREPNYIIGNYTDVLQFKSKRSFWG
jgi:hypothetical protein